MNPKDFANSIFIPEDEKMASCLHCGKEQYAHWIENQDGLCSICLKDPDVKGLTEIRRLVRELRVAREKILIKRGLILLGVIFIMSIIIKSCGG